MNSSVDVGGRNESGRDGAKVAIIRIGSGNNEQS